MDEYSEKNSERSESPGLAPLSAKPKEKKVISEKQKSAGLTNLAKGREKKIEKAQAKKKIATSEYDALSNWLSLGSNPTPEVKEDFIEKTVKQEKYIDYSALDTKLEILNQNLSKTYDKVFKLYEHKKNKQKQPQQPIIVTTNGKQDDYVNMLRSKILNR